MNYTPSPWHFPQVVWSPDHRHKAVYGNLYEIGMGSPLCSKCFLEINGIRIKLGENCAGPAIWNDTGDKLALPIWTRERSQLILVADVTAMTVTTYSRGFSVLLLEEFSWNIIRGIISPVTSKLELVFNVETEAILYIHDI